MPPTVPALQGPSAEFTVCSVTESIKTGQRPGPSKVAVPPSCQRRPGNERGQQVCSSNFRLLQERSYTQRGLALISNLIVVHHLTPLSC